MSWRERAVGVTVVCVGFFPSYSFVCIWAFAIRMERECLMKKMSGKEDGEEETFVDSLGVERRWSG